MIDFQLPRGTRDILPSDQPYWQFLLSVLSQKAKAFGFEQISTPTFEDEKLFTKAIGTATDIVEKELFRVSRAAGQDDKEDQKAKLALRPEGTAGIVRAYLQNGMTTWTQPVKLWYTGSMFRYDRPQKGRFREFQQFGVELIGDDSPATDALIILLAWEIFDALGLGDNIVIDINSLGDKNCQPKIKKALLQYFSKFKKDLCVSCQRRLATNPLRLLDCKEASCQPIKANAPQLIDLLDEDCKRHFQAVLEYLDELNIPYDLNRYLVRGLDYYTKTTFEIRAKNDDRRQNAAGGGGRYNNLIELYGGQDTPAIGFALGLDRIVDLLKENDIQLPSQPTPDICIIQLGDIARREALTIVKEVTRAGFSVVTAPGKDALKSQLRLSNKVKAKLAVIIGQKEALEKSVIIKNLTDGSQETVSRKKLLDQLKKKLTSL